VTINEEPGFVLRRLSAGQPDRSVRLGVAPSYVRIARSGVVLRHSVAFSGDQQARMDVRDFDSRRLLSKFWEQKISSIDVDAVDWADQMTILCVDNRTIGTINTFDRLEIKSRSVDGLQLRYQLWKRRWLLSRSLTDTSPHGRPISGNGSRRIFAIGSPLGCCRNLVKSG
jgi:hypothetical protein